MPAPLFPPAPPPPFLITQLVQAALAEDLGRAGDITTAALIPPGQRIKAVLTAREPGVVAGLPCAEAAFRLLDPEIRFETVIPDGGRVAAGGVIARLSGLARAVLGAERVALNFLCHLSGIATLTAAITAALAPSRTRLVCTRKTLPGLRALQKYAVRLGGGFNHRFGLDDAVLIKDNHIALCGGVAEAVRRARAAVGHMVKIACEAETLEDVAAALAAGVDAVLLDNMTPAALRAAVALIGGRAVSEASGRITPETAPEIAATGVDLVSAGWITHSARALDIGLDLP
jgi:nicotinate-nucleotide pyrophosphorylase (carboxylating)